MKHLFLALSFVISFFSSALAQIISSLNIEKPLVEYQTNPLGLGETIPRFSWQLISTQKNITQKNYQLQVATDDKFSKKSLFWVSDVVNSDASQLVEYMGPKLMSRQRYYWKVKVTDNYNNVAESVIQFFEMGLLHPSDWQAQWIEPEKDDFDTKKMQPVPLLRKEFMTNKGKIASARLYVTSRGLHEVLINGKRVGTAVLAPGWTAYQKRIQYHSYNITSMIQPGPNAIGAMLGDGWYRGFLAWENNRNVYGKKLALLAQIVIKYADGSEQIIGTDDTWKAANDGPIRTADLYMGENYDARMEKKGWASVGFDTSAWWNVKIGSYPKDNLVPLAGPAVRKIEEIKTIKIIKTPAGETVFDLGQNLVGWVRLKVQGQAGTVITIHHAEVLDKNGNFYTDNLRTATCELKYTLRGDSVEVYEPRFTFMGFRYVRVRGLTTEATTDHITAVVIHSDMKSAGEFKCSNPLLNQLQHNIVWGQKGNFVDVPTDCPQRDERLGWTGDAQAFARTATFNYNVAGFFTKWLKDVAIDQKPNGGVPFVVPDVLQIAEPDKIKPSAGWADVATIAPWTMYQVYADRRLLENQYESMKKWVGYVRNNAGPSHLWTNGQHFGDWLSYRGTNVQFGEPVTDNELIATAFYAYSAKLTSQAALTLGRAVDAVEYNELFDKIKAAFNKEYVSPNGRMTSNTQTAYTLALHFDLLPDNLRQQAANRLVADIKAHNDHLTTGFLGTPYLCEVLTRFGHHDVAYRLLNQESYPSWLYPVKMGATTIWERWDGIKPDGTFQDVGMNSFNHYAYGAIGDWMYRHIAGIDLGQAGFKKITIEPKPGGGLTNASAVYETPYGQVSSSWELANGKTSIDIKIPANTSATVILPNASAAQIKELTQAQNLKVSGKGIELGSGVYSFVY